LYGKLSHIRISSIPILHFPLSSIIDILLLLLLMSSSSSSPHSIQANPVTGIDRCITCGAKEGEPEYKQGCTKPAVLLPLGKRESTQYIFFLKTIIPI
jgi:hypothetical protein